MFKNLNRHFENKKIKIIKKTKQNKTINFILNSNVIYLIHCNDDFFK